MWPVSVAIVKANSTRGEGRTVGIVGSGQLARMMAEAAPELDIATVVLAETPNESATGVADRVIVGEATNLEDLFALAAGCDVITFDHEKMTLRVPTRKAKTAGLRPLANNDVVTSALTTLKGRARVKRTMWSRRAQEYEAKINSGDLVSIAEVVRDLHRAENQPEQSYSERQLYESALDRMAREVAAIEQIDRDAAIGLLTKSLIKAA